MTDATATAAVATKKTYVWLVVDRSGSMGSIREAARSGINEQLNALKQAGAQGGDTLVSYLQFDAELETVFWNRRAADLVPITAEQYVPRGTTALFDAVGLAISRAETEVAADDTAWLVIVVSDGEENASHEWNQPRISTKIRELEATGHWTFTFMLANQDIHDAARKLGVRASNVAGFVPDSAGMALASDQNARGATAYLASRAAGATASSDFYGDASNIASKPRSPDAQPNAAPGQPRTRKPVRKAGVTGATTPENH